MDVGISRVELVLGSLDFCGSHSGARDGHGMGWVKDVGCSAKPKRKKRKNRKKKKKLSPSGPKPNSSAFGNQAYEPTRETLEARSFQARETSKAGAAHAADAIGSMSLLPSILGRYEWVCSVGQPAKAEVELGLSSTEVCELELGFGLAIHTRYEVGSSS